MSPKAEINFLPCTSHSDIEKQESRNPDVILPYNGSQSVMQGPLESKTPLVKSVGN